MLWVIAAGIVVLAILLPVRRRRARARLAAAEAETAHQRELDAAAEERAAAAERAEAEARHRRWRDAAARAVTERLAHETERPHRYPADQRLRSALQRAQRIGVREGLGAEPADLEQLVADALRRV